jgi:hypothetical protein
MVFLIDLLTYPYKKGFQKKKISFEDFHDFQGISTYQCLESKEYLVL